MLELVEPEVLTEVVVVAFVVVAVDPDTEVLSETLVPVVVVMVVESPIGDVGIVTDTLLEVVVVVVVLVIPLQ